MDTQSRHSELTRRLDLSGSRLLKSGLSAAAIATVVNLWVANASAELFALSPEFVLLNFWHISNTTFGVTLIATLVYAVTSTYADTDRPDRLFVKVAAVATVLSFVPFLLAVPGRPGGTIEAVATVGLLHVTTAVVVVAVLVFWTRNDGVAGDV